MDAYLSSGSVVQMFKQSKKIFRKNPVWVMLPIVSFLFMAIVASVSWVGVEAGIVGAPEYGDNDFTFILLYHSFSLLGIIWTHIIYFCFSLISCISLSALLKGIQGYLTDSTRMSILGLLKSVKPYLSALSGFVLISIAFVNVVDLCALVLIENSYLGVWEVYTIRMVLLLFFIVLQFFVIPSIVIDNSGLVKAVRHSIHLFKLSFTKVLGAVLLLLSALLLCLLPLLLVDLLAIMFAFAAPPTFAFLIMVTGVVLSIGYGVVVGIIFSVLGGILLALLYSYVSTGSTNFGSNVGR